jgi:hypothetical protein
MGTDRLVFTDPPYHDDVQYGELAQLFYVWMAVSTQTPAPDERAEAVPNAVRGTDTKDYEALVAACLAESRRTLQRDGREVLTFHNNDVTAWAALANALARAAAIRQLLAARSAMVRGMPGYEPASGPLCDGTLTGRRGARNIWRRPFKSSVGISRSMVSSTPLASAL